MSLEQWTQQIVLADSEVPLWRKHGREALRMFEAELRRRGLVASHAPALPLSGAGCQGFIRQPYRVIMQWIPDWVPHSNAGKHVVRVDTFAEPEARLQSPVPAPHTEQVE